MVDRPQVSTSFNSFKAQVPNGPGSESPIHHINVFSEPRLYPQIWQILLIQAVPKSLVLAPTVPYPRPSAFGQAPPRMMENIFAIGLSFSLLPATAISYLIPTNFQVFQKRLRVLHATFGGEKETRKGDVSFTYRLHSTSSRHVVFALRLTWISESEAMQESLKKS